MIPEILIIDCEAELQQLRSVVCNNLDMPSLMDFHGAFEQVVDAIQSLSETEERLPEAASDFSFDRMFMKDDWGDDQVWDMRTEAFEAFVNLGLGIQGKLEGLGAYVTDHLPYQFRTLLDADTFILTRIDAH